MPPSTGMTVPVMKDARSEARNATTSRDVRGRSKAAERNARQNSLPHFLGQCRVRHRRIQNGRRHGIDGDVTRPEFAREPHGQRHDAGFGCAVERVAHRAAAAHSRHRCDIDDTAAARRRHRRHRRLHAIDNAVDIDPCDAVEFTRRQIGDVAGREQPRGIHENFGCAGSTAQRGEGRFDRTRLGDVEGNGVSGEPVVRHRNGGTRGGVLRRDLRRIPRNPPPPAHERSPRRCRRRRR